MASFGPRTPYFGTAGVHPRRIDPANPDIDSHCLLRPRSRFDQQSVPVDHSQDFSEYWSRYFVASNVVTGVTVRAGATKEAIFLIKGINSDPEES